MALITTGQYSYPLNFRETGALSDSTDYEGRVDCVFKTDDTSCLTTMEYKVYLNCKTQTAYQNTRWIDSLSIHFEYGQNLIPKEIEYDMDIEVATPAASLNKLTLVYSGSVTGAALHNSSTGMPQSSLRIGLFYLSFWSVSAMDGTPAFHKVRATLPSDTSFTLTPAISPTTISSSSGFLGEPVIINLTHKRTGVYANITYKLGTVTGIVANGVTASSLNWTLPSELIVEFGENEIQKEMILYCDSYLDGVHLGETQAKLTAFLPSTELVPVMNPTVKDINPATVALTGDENRFVRYKSIAEYAINAVAVKGASLVKQQVKNGTYVIDNIPSGTIPNVETGTFEFLAIDNRDMGTSTTIATSNFVEYIKLTCNQKITMEVSGETGATANVRIFGNYFNGDFGAQQNTLKIEIRHTDNSGAMTDWVDITSFSDPILTGGTYDIDFGISGMRYDITYTFQCRATDKLETIATSEYVLKVMPVFDWSESDFNFNVPVTLDGDLTLSNDKTITLGDCSIVNEGEEISINAETINLNAPNVAFNNVSLMNIDNGTWTPLFAEAEAISSYSLQAGWYQKIGNTVTIGFNLSAICNAGYTSTSLMITGAPFAPTTTAFGGGVASRVHIAAGNNFQCWAIDDAGRITGRIQACNLTSNGTLTTSASGLYYGAQDIAITVGGTITYITE